MQNSEDAQRYFTLYFSTLVLIHLFFSPTKSTYVMSLMMQIDYFVDCHYSTTDDRLWVIGGTGSGTLGYFPINPNPVASIGPAEAILEGGHSGVVRSVLPASSTHISSLAQNKGIFGWTGGEDGRLCCWLSDESSEVKRSWVSSTFVMKPHKDRTKNRHHPY